MHVAEGFLTICAFLALGIQIIAAADDRGFGSEIEWKTLDDGLVESQKTNKPLMLIIHKSWCGACKAFKPKFAASNEIKEASKDFIMVNTEDDEEPKDSKYTPDGGYVPRILFLDPSGNVLTDVFNKQGNPNYKYYYPQVEAVLEAMKTAAAILNSGEQKIEL